MLEEEGEEGSEHHHEGEDVHDESWPRLSRFLSVPFFPDLIKPRLLVPGFGEVSPSPSPGEDDDDDDVADEDDASESEDKGESDASESHEDA